MKVSINFNHTNELKKIVENPEAKLLQKIAAAVAIPFAALADLFIHVMTALFNLNKHEVSAGNNPPVKPTSEVLVDEKTPGGPTSEVPVNKAPKKKNQRANNVITLQTFRQNKMSYLN